MGDLFLGGRIELVQGDITLRSEEAIVNAANTSLLGGGGVDGAIHRAAGPELLEECRLLGGARTGEAKLTDGHRLRASKVIHTVGPIWSGGEAREDQLLEDCYRSCLGLARSHGLRSIAFPAISTGVYAFPKERATRIAIRTTALLLAEEELPERVVFCCFSDGDLELYRRLCGELIESPTSPLRPTSRLRPPALPE